MFPLSTQTCRLNCVFQIECCIDEWITGVKTDVTFYADEYRSIYQGHINSLQTFGSVTSKHDLLGRLQRTLYNFGRYVLPFSNGEPLTYDALVTTLELLRLHSQQWIQFRSLLSSLL